MALTTGSLQSPSGSEDTPTPDPYRLATSAVRLPREATTTELATIRAGIEPRTRWWDFEFQPWHFWTAVSSCAVIAIAFVLLIIKTGAIR